MKIIRPVIITPAMLTSSDVPETDYAAYNAGTTYYESNRCISGHKIYESLPLSDIELLTLDVAPAIPWLPPWTITGQTSLQTCQIVQYLTNTTYLVKNRSGAFTLGEVIGVTGTASLLADQGAAKPTFASAPNVGHDPATDVASPPDSTKPTVGIWWKEVSATNRWKPFDAKVGSQVSQATSLTYKITPGEIFDSIAFLNVDAASILITCTDPVAGVVYTKTIELVRTMTDQLAGVYDWYSYFFSDYFRIADAAVFDIPPFLNAVVDITITYTGGTVLCGGIVLGLQTTIGGTQFGASVGIVDYSIKTTDAYGVTSIDQRDYAKRMNCDVEIPSGSTANVNRLLASYRSTALVWVGADDVEALIVYGFFKSFETVIAYPDYDVCSIEIEGLT